MADLELVIKLDEDIAQGIIDGKNDKPRNIVRSFQATIANAIKNGTPLPKGHGRLIDADAFNEELDSRDYDTHNDYSNTFDWIEQAPTIIEADEKEGEAE